MRRITQLVCDRWRGKTDLAAVATAEQQKRLERLHWERTAVTQVWRLPVCYQTWLPFHIHYEMLFPKCISPRHGCSTNKGARIFNSPFFILFIYSMLMYLYLCVFVFEKQLWLNSFSCSVSCSVCLKTSQWSAFHLLVHTRLFRLAWNFCRTKIPNLNCVCN